MNNTTTPAAPAATDAELLAALDRGVAAGAFVVVDDEFLANLKAEIDAEEATEEAPAEAAEAAAPRPYAVVLADLVRFGEMSNRRTEAGLPRLPELDAYATQLAAEASAALAAEAPAPAERWTVIGRRLATRRTVRRTVEAVSREAAIAAAAQHWGAGVLVDGAVRPISA
jgi:hypothetical protein